MIIPLLAIAGSLGPQEARAAVARARSRSRRRCSRRCSSASIVIVGALTFFPALSLGPIVEHFLMTNGTGVLMAHAQAHSPSGIRRSSAAQPADAVRKLDPRTMAKNPVMFVVEVGSVLTTILLVLDAVAGGTRHRLRAADHVLALAHRAVRQLRRGDGRRTRQGAGRHAAQGADRDRRQPRCVRRTRTEDRCRRRRCARATSCSSTAGEFIPGRRRNHRGRRVGRRVGDHGRIGAGHPRIRRRPLGGHRRHARAVGLDQGPRHRRSRATRSSTA